MWTAACIAVAPALMDDQTNSVSNPATFLSPFFLFFKNMYKNESEDSQKNDNVPHFPTNPLGIHVYLPGYALKRLFVLLTCVLIIFRAKSKYSPDIQHTGVRCANPIEFL